MSWEIVEARVGHIRPIARNMRSCDEREVWASHGYNPEEAMDASFWRSLKAWTCLVDGEPAFMWGVGPQESVMGNVDCPWLLGTDAMKKVKLDFIKLSRRYVDDMQELYPRLENYVHAENKVSIRWLKWCGFELAEEPEEYGVNPEKFYRFWR